MGRSSRACAAKPAAGRSPGNQIKFRRVNFRSAPATGASSRSGEAAAVASTRRRDWARNPIDRFILAALAEQGSCPPPRPTSGR